MMGGVSPETCWAIKKQWNNKFYYTVASCWLFPYDLYYDKRIHEHQELRYFRYFYMLVVTSTIRPCYHSNTISLTSHTSKCDLRSKNGSNFLMKVWVPIVSLIFRTAPTPQKHAKYQAGANTNMQIIVHFTSSGRLAHDDWSTVAECYIFRVKHCEKAIGPADVHHATGSMTITLHVWILRNYQNQIQTVPWLAIPNHCLWWLTL